MSLDGDWPFWASPPGLRGRTLQKGFFCICCCLQIQLYHHFWYPARSSRQSPLLLVLQPPIGATRRQRIAIGAERLCNAGEIWTRLLDHRPFLNGEIKYFVKEFEADPLVSRRELRKAEWHHFITDMTDKCSAVDTTFEEKQAQLSAFYADLEHKLHLQ
ncbi:uncharacterized protein LOC134539247 isoform X2 [Bacillus rossius redtenbacheri]|uniref:uncharacterized protein LOC134539247 isoform X2 n=1 Tax=Bacillus rossius redtenbacheri TaxID=93214 RepID=UPI002FDE75D3